MYETSCTECGLTFALDLSADYTHCPRCEYRAETPCLVCDGFGYTDSMSLCPACIGEGNPWQTWADVPSLMG